MNDIQAAKRRRERRRYSEMVMHVYEDLTHQDKRREREERARIERESRNRL